MYIPVIFLKMKFNFFQLIVSAIATSATQLDPCLRICQLYAPDQLGDGEALCGSPDQSHCVNELCTNLFWSRTETGVAGLIYSTDGLDLTPEEASSPLTCQSARETIPNQVDLSYFTAALEIFIRLPSVARIFANPNASVLSGRLTSLLAMHSTTTNRAVSANLIRRELSDLGWDITELSQLSTINVLHTLDVATSREIRLDIGDRVTMNLGLTCERCGNTAAHWVRRSILQLITTNDAASDIQSSIAYSASNGNQIQYCQGCSTMTEQNGFHEVVASGELLLVTIDNINNNDITISETIDLRPVVSQNFVGATTYRLIGAVHYHPNIPENRIAEVRTEQGWKRLELSQFEFAPRMETSRNPALLVYERQVMPGIGSSSSSR